ncbi:EamA family transporter [Reichenbachiella agarivorans]|uniref:EamA family transporter n=1 Tax=Reichenbachiella agarivorans TaxID=2979464 RepID=A0ABY6CR41_9BACT|nr:EamA family transporter [Reichenbachiella agarivorans]UXP32309.1 EamA family transporter [Reichenbachiella agarivorans]
MPPSNFLLYAIPALIWGSTWFVITFQLGKVDPLISVVYRYLVAGTLMMLYCLIRKVPMRFTPRQHFFMALQGAFLFGINYWMAYKAEEYIPSGLMAVAFSTIVFSNSILGYFLMGKRINKGVMIGAILGLTGTTLIFSKEFFFMAYSEQILLGSGIAMLSVVLASLGNLASARNSAAGIPVVQANAFGMVYGAGLMALLAMILGKEFTFEWTQSYILSLLYLSIFGSITAFGFYLTLVGRIGADKAAYALVVIPIISIFLSTLFEDYQLTWFAFGGVVLIVLGNLFALRKRKGIKTA